ncbi:DUF11 domain-containing protein [Ramlibacter sp. 2FC]|uniref:DUF11 domain-containing protein n=1 Tax=Ramlibacter sp. 2FC TaxID=2502188 RepID=UPI0010F70D68|nr:DUF11 domain-containing protein [Ramlibacter sp. 2FC]
MKLLHRLLGLVLLCLLAAPAQAACGSGACVSSGPRLASMDSSQATLYSGLLSQLTGSTLALSVADWNALAEGGTNLGSFLDALAAEMGVAGREQALAGGATLSQIASAMAADARAQGRGAAAAALDALAAQFDSLAGTLRLAELIEGGGAAYDAQSLRTLDFVTGLVQLYNAEGLAAAREPVTLSGESLGLSGMVQAVRLSAQATEPPVFACGPAGTQFHSAAMRYQLEVDLVPSSPDVSALTAVPGIAGAQLTLSRLTLYGEVARGSGVIAAVDALARSVTVQATPGLASLYLGRIAQALFNDPGRAIDPATDLDFAPVGELTITDAAGQSTTTAVEARGHAQGQASQAALLVFNGPFPETQTARADAGFASGMVAELMSSLALRTNPGLGAADPQVQDALAPVLRDSLAPLVQTLVTQALDPALQMFGIGLGEMDVTVDGLYGACVLSGHVYHDADHDGRRAAGEGATGHAHYAKLRRAGDASGPAQQVVAVDAADGAYRFPALAPGRYELWIARDADPASSAALPPPGWLPTEPRQLRRAELEMGERDLEGQDFGLYPGSRISGSVFRDSGASPHDGRRDGDEPGLAGAALQLTDAAGTTRHDGTRSAADGRWVLWLPASAAGAVKIVQTNLAGHLSTGADAGTSGGSYDHGADSLSFSATAGTDYAGLHFGDVPVGRFGPDGRQGALPGSVLFYPHRFVAGSRGSLALGATALASPEWPGWNTLLYRDADCSGALDPDEDLLPAELGLAPDEALCVLAKVFVPGNAPFGAQHRLSLAASFRHQGAQAPIDFVLTQEDLTTVGAGGDAALRLSKRADRSAAQPGETISYTIGYRNDGAGALTDLRIFDLTPAHTRFVAAACGALPAQASACTVAAQPDAGGRGRVEWRIVGAVHPGASGSVSFVVQLD